MIKIAVAVADEKAGPSAFVVWRGFDSSFKKSEQYGYDGIELALRTRQDISEHEIKSLCRQYHLEISGISTGQVFADLGLNLADPDNGRRAEAVQVLSDLVKLAGEFGCMVNLGRARGSVAPGQRREQTERLFLDSLSKLLFVAERVGTTIIVEPVNRYEINFINTVAQCADLLKGIKSKYVGIMPDVFHMNIEEKSIGKSIEEYGDSIRYIHLADSNRLAPGWGHLDFTEVFTALDKIGYAGWASVEILPEPNPDGAAAHAIKTLQPFLQRFCGGRKGRG